MFTCHRFIWQTVVFLIMILYTFQVFKDQSTSMKYTKSEYCHVLYVFNVCLLLLFIILKKKHHYNITALRLPCVCDIRPPCLKGKLTYTISRYSLPNMKSIRQHIGSVYTKLDYRSDMVYCWVVKRSF